MEASPTVGMFERWPAVRGTDREGGRRIGPSAQTDRRRDGPLVSVVTVARNPGAAIRKTTQSIRAQSYANIEHIVIDGGSVDGTTDWLQANEDCIDYWISEPDSGIYAAMNKGLMLARGSIIGLLNCGDEYTPESVATVVRQIPLARCGEAIILGGAMERTEESRNLVFRLPATQERLRNRLAHGMPLNHPATFVTAEAYRVAGLFDPSFRLCGDYEFIYRAVRHGGIRFEFVAETLAVMPMGGVSERVSSLWTRAREHYRIRKGSMGQLNNLLNCGQLIAVNGAKLVAKARLSGPAMRFYYRRRHSR
jgi:glycosyltransferase involved in cell wall biosynthesis